MWTIYFEPLSNTYFGVHGDMMTEHQVGLLEVMREIDAANYYRQEDISVVTKGCTLVTLY